MAKAKRTEKVIEPEKVIPAVVEEEIVLTLTRDEAHRIFSLVANTNANHGTFGIYQALATAFTGKDFGLYTPKHTVRYSASLIQLKEG